MTDTERQRARCSSTDYWDGLCHSQGPSQPGKVSNYVFLELLQLQY